MKAAVVLLLSCFVAAAVAWPLKPDDKAQRMREADEIADKNLDAWKEAVRNADKSTRLSDLTLEIVETVREAQQNNVKLNRGMVPLMTIMNHLARPTSALLQPLSFLKLRALSLLTHLLDGNRDNFSYYRLEGVREWIERRTQEDGIQNMEQLTQAHNSVIEARDALERMASTFVAALKHIKAETSHVFLPDKQKISHIAKNMVQVANDNKDVLIQKTQEAGDLLLDAASKFFAAAETVDVEP